MAIKKIIKFYEKFGLIITLKKILVASIDYKIQIRVDIYHLLMSKIFGEQLVYKLLLSKYKWKLKHSLFFRRSKSFWIGKNLNHIHLNIVWVDPSEIKFQIKDGDVPFVQNGDWDKNKAPFILNDAIDELYVKFPPLSIEDTQQYKLMISQIEQGLTIRGCSNKNDVLKYFKDLDILFCSLELGKYLTQNELGDHVNIPDDSRYPNEIIVSIDRFGNYLHERGGSHRLSIAKVLKLPKVPVIIIRKHLNIFNKENNHDNTF